MSDHWKSLADLLGSPGIDAPSRSEPEKESRGAVKSERSEKEAGRKEHSVKSAGSNAPEVVVQQVSFQKESRSTARSSEQTSVSETINAGESPAKSVQPQPASHSEVTKPVAKKRSSWDSLTKLFGISSPEPESAPQPPAVIIEPSLHDQVSPERKERTQPRPAFDSTPPNQRSSSALETLFEDVPRKSEHSWRDESSLRVVDDVSWDDPDTLDETKEIGLKSDDEGMLDDESTGRSRRRRRRRRGGGSRGRDSERPDVEPLEESDAVAGEVSWSEVEDSDDSSDAMDVWSEPQPSVSSDSGEDAAEEFEAERRSNRRRRRGHGAPRGDEGSEPAAEASDIRRPVEDRGPREPARRSSGRQSDRQHAPADRERVTPPRSRDREEDRERERPDRPRHSRDRDRQGSAERVRPASQRELPKFQERPRPIDSEVSEEIDEIDELYDADMESDVDEPGGKHRKIPSWADSLESIITHNMENRRRHDGSRDSGPRGRPRGRR